MTLSIKPFKAFRPLQKRVEEVVLPTFDNLTNKQLNKILKESEYNFLNVVSPKAFYPNITKKNSKKHAYEHLESMIKNNIIFQEKEECFYIYCLDKYNKKQFGIVASIEFEEGNNQILKHEAIFKARSNSIMETIEHTKMQIGPVYLSYKNQNSRPIDFKKYERKKPLYKFKSPGGTTRSLWKVSKKNEIGSLRKKLSKIQKFYIADGHHRYSAIENLNKNLNKKNYILSDGGITCPGDLGKAFGAGADFIMIGGEFAGHDENPGKIIEDEITKEKYKFFYGMSSMYAMKNNYSSTNNIDYRSSEGREIKIKYKGPLENTLKNYLGGLRSTCTYTNSKNIDELEKNVKFILVNNQYNNNLVNDK